MVTTPVRAAPPLALIRNRTAPLPVPALSISSIHDAVVDADQLQSALACTAIASVRAAALVSTVLGDTTTPQVPGCCCTPTRVPSTTMAPSRIVGVGLGMAVNETVAAPRPLAGVTLVIHSDALDAVHEQSSVAETATVAVPPPGPRLSAGAVTLTEHFVDDGLTEVDVLVPHAATNVVLSTAARSAMRDL